MDTEIILVGTGVCSYVAADLLTKARLHFSIIAPSFFDFDNSVDQTSNEKPLVDYPRQINVDSARSCSSDSSRPKSINLNEMPFGGLLNFWGGISFPYNHKSYSKLGLKYEDYISAFKYIQSFMPFSNYNARIWGAFLEQDSLELVGRPVRSEFETGETWNITRNFADLISFHEIPCIVGKVSSYQNFKNSIQVNYYDEFGDLKSSKANFAVMGCGPTGNAEILLKSEASVEDLAIKDSNVLYLMAITLKPNRLDDQMKPYLFVKKRKETFDYYAQIYPLTFQLINRLPFRKFLHFVVGLFSVFTRHMNPVLFYLPDGMSKNVKVTPNQRVPKRKFDQVRKEWAQLLDASKVLRRHKLYILPFYKRTRPGKGMHSGAFLRSDKDGEVSTTNDSVPISPRVIFIGASNLPSIEPGPITFSAMVQTHFVISRLIKRITRTTDTIYPNSKFGSIENDG